MKKKTICPKCGKHTLEVHRYTGRYQGDQFFIHSRKRGLLGFNEIQGCYIKKALGNHRDGNPE